MFHPKDIDMSKFIMRVPGMLHRDIKGVLHERK
jgi:hypothetical protein